MCTQTIEGLILCRQTYSSWWLRHLSSWQQQVQNAVCCLESQGGQPYTCATSTTPHPTRRVGLPTMHLLLKKHASDQRNIPPTDEKKNHRILPRFTPHNYGGQLPQMLRSTIPCVQMGVGNWDHVVVYDGHSEGLMASARVWWMFRVSSLSFSPLLMASIHCATLLLSFYVTSFATCCLKFEVLSIARDPSCRHTLMDHALHTNKS